MYKENWKGWADWLGTENYKPKRESIFWEFKTARKYEVDYLVFVDTEAYHFFNSKSHYAKYENGKPYPETAFGNMRINGIIVNGKTGVIENIFGVHIAGWSETSSYNPTKTITNTSRYISRTKLKSKKVKNLVKRFGNKLKRKSSNLK